MTNMFPDEEAPYKPMPKTNEVPNPHLVCGPCPACDWQWDHCTQAQGGPDMNLSPHD